MTKDTTIQVRIDSDTKEKVEALYRDMGTTFSEAVRIFAVQSLLIGGMPLVLRSHPAESSSYGKLSAYADPALIEHEKDAFADAMRKKYGKAD